MNKSPNFRTGGDGRGDPYSENDHCSCEPYDSSYREYKENIKNNPINMNTFCPTFNPSITINVFPATTPGPIGVETVQYIAYSQEGKNVYTNSDALKQYGSNDILNPTEVSNINLFVNGVLQPPSIYEVDEGILRLKSSDLPPEGAPIILLFVILTG